MVQFNGAYQEEAGKLNVAKQPTKVRIPTLNQREVKEVI